MTLFTRVRRRMCQETKCVDGLHPDAHAHLARVMKAGRSTQSLLGRRLVYESRIHQKCDLAVKFDSIRTSTTS